MRKKERVKRERATDQLALKCSKAPSAFHLILWKPVKIYLCGCLEEKGLFDQCSSCEARSSPEAGSMPDCYWQPCSRLTSDGSRTAQPGRPSRPGRRGGRLLDRRTRRSRHRRRRVLSRPLRGPSGQYMSQTGTTGSLLAYTSTTSTLYILYYTLSTTFFIHATVALLLTENNSSDFTGFSFFPEWKKVFYFLFNDEDIRITFCRQFFPFYGIALSSIILTYCMRKGSQIVYIRNVFSMHDFLSPDPIITSLYLRKPPVISIK